MVFQLAKLISQRLKKKRVQDVNMNLSDFFAHNPFSLLILKYVGWLVGTVLIKIHGINHVALVCVSIYQQQELKISVFSKQINLRTEKAARYFPSNTLL